MRENRIVRAFLIVAIFVTTGMSWVYAQESKAYYLDGDEVVFVFDIRDYEQVTSENERKRLDFEELRIEDVAVTGEFTLWSRKGWKMKKVGEYTYQLRKNLNDFNDAFPLQFKYIINEEYWAEPGATFPNVRKFEDEFFEETYNLTLFDVNPDVDGNTTFFLSGHSTARSVILTGTFVGWDEDYLKMEKVPDGWEMRLDLLPGRYEYKFIVDGEWMHDLANPDVVVNQHGTLNSVLQTTRNFMFSLDGHSDAAHVEILASFKGWTRTPLVQNGDTWNCTLALPNGKYHYKFVVDGRYVLDPKNLLVERTKDGLEFNVKIIQ